MPKIAVVVDLGFGDAGKGLLTDFLTRELGAATVVRFNGGAQAGHNVVGPDGTHHCFSQLGAGMLTPGVRTFLSSEVVVDPLALRVEASVLAQKVGGDPLTRLALDGDARIITPYHRAANQLRERLRGERAHGSCGVGFGETVQDALEHPLDTVHAQELTDRAALRRKLARVRERKRAELLTLASGSSDVEVSDALALFEDAAFGEQWMDAVAQMGASLQLGDAALLGRWLAEGPAVFEGAQGVLLDEQHGFHPHTTWSTCTFAPALRLLQACAPGAEVERVGVLRSHMVRHGAGPLPSETLALNGRVHDHNQPHPFQGSVRYGWFDAPLFRYALAATGGVDQLALTHLVLLNRASLFAATGYAQGSEWLTPDPRRSLDAQEVLTRALFEATPCLERLPAHAEGALEVIEALLGHEVTWVSTGSRSTDVRARRAL